MYHSSWNVCPAVAPFHPRQKPWQDIANELGQVLCVGELLRHIIALCGQVGWPPPRNVTLLATYSSTRSPMSSAAGVSRFSATSARITWRAKAFAISQGGSSPTLVASASGLKQTAVMYAKKLKLDGRFNFQGPEPDQCSGSNAFFRWSSGRSRATRSPGRGFWGDPVTPASGTKAEPG